MITAKQIIDEIKEHIDNGTRQDPQMRSNYTSIFSENRNWTGLKAFRTELIELAPSSVAKHVGEIAFDFSKYEEQLSQSFSEAKEVARKDEMIRAIYFEHDWGQATFFLCVSFEKPGKDWAGDFMGDFDAPTFDPDDIPFYSDCSAVERLILGEYIHCVVCEYLIKVVKEYSDLPVAMGEHDGSIVYLQP